MFHARHSSMHTMRNSARTRVVTRSHTSYYTFHTLAQLHCAPPGFLDACVRPRRGPSVESWSRGGERKTTKLDCLLAQHPDPQNTFTAITQARLRKISGGGDVRGCGSTTSTSASSARLDRRRLSGPGGILCGGGRARATALRHPSLFPRP